MIYICDKCLRASCWAGIFMCWESQNAALYRVTKSQARRFKREHEDYLNLPEVVAPKTDHSTPTIPKNIAAIAYSGYGIPYIKSSRSGITSPTF
jgi:hypothetical protein